jgi:DNA-binding transcriptional LysR family regulator
VAALPAMEWLERTACGLPIVLRCNSIAALHFAIRAGIAPSILPYTFGEWDADLVRCFPPVHALIVPIWLVTRRELCRLPHVRAIFGEISAQLEAHAALLTGSAAPPDPGPPEIVARPPLPGA